MSIKPRQIDDEGLFSNDWRDSSKFWWLNTPIQPVVGVGPDGRFNAFGPPLELIADTEAGNVGIPAWPEEFVDGQVWHLDAFTITSILGADYTGVVDGIPTGNTVTVAALAAGDLLGNSFYFDAQLGIGVINGAAGDAYTLRARRVA